MSLQTWQGNGWLRPYRTSPAQIAELFARAEAAPPRGEICLLVGGSDAA